MVSCHVADKELQPFVVNEFEPMSDYVRKLFCNYREIRTRVLGWLFDASQKRAELTNRYRRNKAIKAGDEVVLRDPRHRKAGGRTGYRQPYTDPALVLNLHGNKCTVRTQDGTVLKDVHLEDVLAVSDNARNYEKRAIAV